MYEGVIGYYTMHGGGISYNVRLSVICQYIWCTWKMFFNLGGKWYLPKLGVVYEIKGILILIFNDARVMWYFMFWGSINNKIRIELIIYNLYS